jgi:prophage regulatory protein
LIAVTHHLVGTAEIAVLLGVGRQQANRITRRPDFPEPEARLSAGGVWLREDVERWAAEHASRRPGRPPTRPA